MNTGSFKVSPADLGRRWAETHRRFRTLLDRRDVHALEVSYERLAMAPRGELERICRFADLPFDETLLTFNRQRLSIYHNPRGHLSRERISQPIDTTKIGRWRNDLTPPVVDQFMSTAGAEMSHYGYLAAKYHAD
jgi:hypothetical protein